MSYKYFSRTPKGLHTKFGSPCRTIYVNWNAFKQQDKEIKEEKHAKTSMRKV